MRNRFLAAGLVATAVLIAAGCGSSSSGSGSPGGASGTALKTATISGSTVLTNAQGFTLYWFAPDTASKSNCTGSCAQIWPPVKGPATAGSGVTGTLGTINRSDGTVQATYSGHPVYTYTADTAPGQANGNGVNANGGVWHEVTASGGPAPATSPTSGGGGYGY
jgi:predicted lipoprotein with Yx(FWY)xxD motif